MAQRTENNPQFGWRTFSKVIQDITELFSLVGATPDYQVYVATLTQTGTNPPVATVLKNTLSGTPVWSRFGSGSYFMTLNGEFIEGRTAVFHNNTGIDAASNVMAYWEDVNTIFYEVTNGVAYADDRFYKNHTIEVRVYN